MTQATQEVLPSIRSFSVPSERGYLFHATFVPSAGVVIDPVEPSAEVLAELVSAGVVTIALTNRNHFRAAAKVKAATGAKVLVHPDDAAFVVGKGVGVDGPLAAGDSVGPFRVVDASGKSPGEVALHWPERRLLVVGDACIGNPAGKLSLLSEKVMDDPARLRASLRRIAETIDLDTILCGDGEPILSGAHAALLSLIASFPT